jgi:hypothetical protein
LEHLQLGAGVTDAF